MKDSKYQSYIYASISSLIVIILAILFWFVINKFEVINVFFLKISKILRPIAYGAVLAFLFTPLYNKLFKILNKLFLNFKFSQISSYKWAKRISLFSCLLALLLSIYIFTLLIIPQLINSIRSMVQTLPDDVEKISGKIRIFLEAYPEISEYLTNNILEFDVQLTSLVKSTVLPNLNIYISNLSTGFISFFRQVFNVVIGVIVMIYLLSIKTTLSAQIKRIIYSVFSIKVANVIVEETRYIKKVFSQFIVGKLIDSAIIACINYIFMSLFNMEYALLISVIVGITNIVPFFGPFIGAIPSIFILAIDSPMSAVQFMVWILILQQVDGNIIGPKILGQTTGLPSFFILFSILLFGGLFGIVGMIIGVPTFAIIYRFLARQSAYFLKKKNLSIRSSDYINLAYIDEDTKEYKKL